MKTLLSKLLVGFTIAFAAGTPGAQACPFCTAVSQTLGQELDGADNAVIAKLLKLPPEADLEGDDSAGFDIDNPDSGMAEFEVVEVLRGTGGPAPGATIKVVYFGGNEQQKQFLIKGITGERIDWRTPLPLTQRGVEYVKSLDTLPDEGPERLIFFLAHLEDEDPLLAQDAYDEFARAPYEVVIAIGDSMDRQQLIAWIEDAQVGPTRRRLYLTMLGICGQAEDVAILESLLQYDYQQMKPGIAAALAVMSQTGPVVGGSVLNEMIRADVRRKQQCLDALIAAYLKLKGPDGLPLIEERFLTNPAAEYTHVYAAVMALRFHGEETDVLPKPRLLKSVRLVLENHDIADQVIPDLARWEDWEVMDQLVEMFKSSEDDAWVRQPVISYLIAASEQPPAVSDRANSALKELEAIDPEGVKRARSYMAFGLLARSGAKKKTAQTADSETSDSAPAEVDVSTADIQPVPATAVESTEKQTASVAPEQPSDAEPAAVAAVDATSSVGPSRMVIIGGPLIAGLFMFGVFALLLRGADVRSSSDSSQN